MSRIRRGPRRQSRAALEKGLHVLDRTLAGDWFLSYKMARRSKDPGRYHQAHLHVLDGKDVSRSAPLDVAEKNTRGWRFMWVRSDHKPVICEVSRSSADATPELVSVSLGSSVSKIHKLIQKLAREGVFKGAAEVSFLSIPDIQVEAFWLKARKQKHDRIVSILGPSEGLTNMKVYEPEEFFKAATQLAKIRRLARRFGSA